MWRGLEHGAKVLVDVGKWLARTRWRATLVGRGLLVSVRNVLVFIDEKLDVTGAHILESEADEQRSTHLAPTVCHALECLLLL